MGDQVDIVEEMARDPGTRPVCERLTPAQRKALLHRRGQSKGLMARRLVCPGAGFHPTPMGAQWRDDLIEIERMKRALMKLREMLNDGAERSELLDVIAGAMG